MCRLLSFQDVSSAFFSTGIIFIFVLLQFLRLAIDSPVQQTYSILCRVRLQQRVDIVHKENDITLAFQVQLE